ncbi:pyrroline-5-carboxylate reductase [Nocardiopsis chromatogenes]|uniref:pyrroline-5-carboxylate reductase n=1 Tax=Nocardiopsis chromatogenes TaxID=280239 RepID=UPI001EF9D8EB|nr:pyrroline-5-carboxylate reductase [Nocardiopsis chromatogenes]
MISTDALHDPARTRVAVIGAGHLGEAVLGGLLRAGLPAQDVAVSALPGERAQALADRYGVRAGTDNAAAADGADIALVAVPPSVVPAAAAEIGPALPEGAVAVSLAAAVPLARFEEALGPGRPAARAMTNTAAAVGRAMTALVGGIHLDGAARARVGGLFSRIGSIAWVGEEAMDAVTAVAGSGPGFLYHLAAAMADAAVDQGLPPGEARAAVAQTLYGAASLLREADRGPAELAAEVATPGGTTREALDRLDARGVPEAVAEAVAAAAERSRRLAEGAGHI